MKSVFLFLTLLVVFSCKDKDPEPTQIIKNGDIEAEPSSPSTWLFLSESPSGFTSDWTTDEAASGTHSLSITCAVATSQFADWTQFYPNFNSVLKDKKLSFSVKVKGKNLIGKGVSVAIRADAKSGNKFVSTEGTTSINGSFDWTTYELSIPSIPADCTQVYVFLILLPNTTGTVYFDDVGVSY